MPKYAERTSVSSDKSRADIEKTLSRYGAIGFMYGWQPTRAVIAFQMENRHVKFVLPLPDKSSDEFTKTPERGVPRSASAAEAAYEQAVKQRWRALALVIKAKLEAVDAGISVFDDEFLSNIVTPDGQTVGDFMRPQIESAYATGKMPDLLPGPNTGKPKDE